MANVMIRNNDNMVVVIAHENQEASLVSVIKQFNPIANFSVFHAGKVPFAELPSEIQEEALDTLKAFDSVNVTYQNKAFRVSTGVAIRNSYPIDFFPCGTYYAKDLYTEEQRKANYKECFG